MYSFNLYNTNKCINLINRSFNVCYSTDSSNNIIYNVKSRNTKKTILDKKKCLLNDIPLCCRVDIPSNISVTGNKPFILQFQYIGTTDFDTSYILPLNNDGEGFKNIGFTLNPTNPKYLDNVILEIFWIFQDNEAETINSGVTFNDINVLNWYNSNTSNLRVIQWAEIPISRGNASPFGRQFKDLISLIEISAIDSPKILSNTYFNECFMNSINFNSSLDNFDTLNVINMKSMFEGATKFNYNINLNTSNVRDMTNMFKNAINFNKTINFNTLNVITMEGMFNGATNFNNGDVFNIASKPINFNVTNVINMSFMFKNAIKFNQELLFFRGNLTQSQFLYLPGNVITIEEMFNNAILYNNGDISNIGQKPMDFSFMTNLENLRRVFKNAIGFNQNIYMVLDNAKTMEEMFCDAIIFNNGDIGNNGSFGSEYFMPKIETFKGLFKNAISFNQAFKTSGTQLLLTTEEMFSGAVIYNDGNVGNIGGSKTLLVDSIVNMREMYKNCSSFNLKLFFVTSFIGPFNITNTESMFDGATIFNNGSTSNNGLNPIIWDAPLLTNINNMFRNASQFNQRFELNNSFNIINMHGLFNGCSNFNNGSTSNNGLNQINYNTNFVDNMSNMFSFCNSFNQTINFTNTSNVTSMEEMFYKANIYNNGNIGLAAANPINFNTINVINMKRMFRETNINQIINFSDTSNVITMEEMFYKANNFNNGDESNIATKPINWNTSNVINMKNMFAFAVKFNQRLLFNISNITDMSSMFENALLFNSSVTYDISNNYWNTSNIYNRKAFNNMFFGASSFNNGEDIGGTTSPMNWIISFIGIPTNFSIGSKLTLGPAPDGNSPGLSIGGSFMDVNNDLPIVIDL